MVPVVLRVTCCLTSLPWGNRSPAGNQAPTDFPRGNRSPAGNQAPTDFPRGNRFPAGMVPRLTFRPISRGEVDRETDLPRGNRFHENGLATCGWQMMFRTCNPFVYLPFSSRMRGDIYCVPYRAGRFGRRERGASGRAASGGAAATHTAIR